MSRSKSSLSDAHLCVHPALGLVTELVEEGVVPPPGESAGAVEAGGEEHRVTEGGDQGVPDTPAITRHLGDKRILDQVPLQKSKSLILIQ